MKRRNTPTRAKPWKFAGLISVLVTIVAAGGLLAAFLSGRVLWGVVLLLPLVGYEAYRTAGETTRWASWAMLILLIATIALLWLDIDINLAELLGTERTSVAGQAIELGSVQMVMPALMGACALILLSRTRGRFTRFLAVAIFIAAAIVVYLIDPAAVRSLIRAGLARLT